VKQVEALLEAAAGRVAPLLRAQVLHRGRLVLSAGNAPATLRFDLASITKVLATTALVLDLHLDRSTPVTALLPSSVLSDVTLDDLLFHRSGLKPFIPFFAQALEQCPALRDADCSGEVRAQVRREVIARVLATPAEALKRTRTAYSDLGFIVLGAALEASTQLPLQVLFAQRIAQPLGLTASFQRVSAKGELPTAPTGATRPREPAPGQEGQWQVATSPGRAGEVDDDNAWVMDGVSGHAGVFGTAHDVALFGQALLDGRFTAAWNRDPFLPSSTRTIGFDTPGLEAPSCGTRFGRAGPRGAIGHLGFTGTSLWVDLDRELVVVLLTNRVAYGRANLSIREFRPAFHDAVLEALAL
jgi:serine-type D-Ala-D-Ala carboxypeptidase